MPSIHMMELFGDNAFIVSKKADSDIDICFHRKHLYNRLHIKFPYFSQISIRETTVSPFL